MPDNTLPHLRKAGAVTQLIVGEKPFLILGGEIGNSSASDLSEFPTMYRKLRQMQLNTVLAPVHWDRIEQNEGAFDFSELESSIQSARENSLRLVLLWFGTWKNSMSCYAPGWVKRDTTRFERVHLSSGEAVEIISPHSEAAREADARAFSALMQYLKNADGTQHTVLMVQVENEIGMIPEARDHSASAEAAYRESVPQTLLAHLLEGNLGPGVTSLWHQAGKPADGSWGEVFASGAAGDEVFSAWHFAAYVEAVTAAGKQHYALPMIVNAALMRPGYEPGQYPSAGPLPHLMEVWQAGAPSLDMFCPDIYFPNFCEWAGRYVRGKNALFIPEMAASARVGGNVVYAIGQIGAIGVAPFAIETTDKHEMIADCYRVLRGMSDVILDCQGKGKVIALSPQVAFDWSFPDRPERGELGGIVFEATFEHSASNVNDQITVMPTLGAGRWEAPVGTPLGAALICQIAPEEFVIMGMGVTITFAPADDRGKIGIEHVQQGWYEEGVWNGGRWLNGDETHQGRHVSLSNAGWQVQRVGLYRYG